MISRRIFIIITIAVVGAAGALVIIRRDGTELVRSILPDVPGAVNPTPSPFPFQELTIPYLKSRKYDSNLGSLERVSENANYISYLTSYESDGLRINAQLTEPKGPRPEGGWPAVIFIHGYIPPGQYQTLTNYSSYVDYLSKNGLAVFKIDLRGHANSEGEPGGAYYSSDYVIDALNAYSALQKAQFVNPDKIGLWGHSMAGNVVFRSLAAKPEIPAVVIWAGAGYTYSDIREFGIDDDSYRPPPSDTERQRRRRELFDTYGDFNAESSFWEQVAPTNYLGEMKGAVQLNHATNDNVVSVRYSRNLTNLLKDAGVRHELHEYGGGGHNFSGASFNAAMQNTVTFFQENLR
ncbi:MAG: alpha/beta fold hydrolase [Candidatus Curtissbacteria bacterium]|nr:alpha/beta fold hydrolase [Candidatus Curtissbacteria bacterium]